jgi:hypothetical protein
MPGENHGAIAHLENGQKMQFFSDELISSRAPFN